MARPGADGLAARPALDEIERRVAARRDAVKAALGSYPAPITACDAQYNHLSEERRRLSLALLRLGELRGVPDSAERDAAIAAALALINPDDEHARP